ncbi:hypothetical protein DAPPUDRAFT_329554 [Daphnia pulex]|uniref:Uncharacterized protein n=1 Tax=Daphnia pulex TaxID=6669 RepID=E9HGY8_DAPPU|nr:hypothetical protein DAPPUDRAFT_329554 [Daphnia pulex]|eukprot:EFX68968.1 hypothetical protein DAPPUDRAFT_329554 [Daphnia pulex]
MAKWFLATYIRDVWSRLSYLKASITSVYGAILKIDSTKKIARKLQGTAADSVSWCTNIGNENGEVLLSLLTTSESLANLGQMAERLMARYDKAQKAPPRVLYTDHDCCRSNDKSKFQLLFNKWEDLVVRLDVWHFIRRLSNACNNESHPLYGTFMSGISGAIFEWDAFDVNLLRDAKRAELKLAGIQNPSTETVEKAVTKTELARHCRRKTRGTEVTIRLLDQLCSSFTGITDSLGVPILKEDAIDIFETEKWHVNCIQDPDGVQLYTKTGELVKGGITLPVYRCSRGTTSLESLHSHIKNFIPGNAANDVHFQAFLLVGIARWNLERSSSSIEPTSRLRSFDRKLQEMVNRLSTGVLGIAADPLFTPLSVYTGELFGVEYLYNEKGTLAAFDDVDRKIDDGVEVADEPFDFNCCSAGMEDDPELDLACTSFTHASSDCTADSVSDVSDAEQDGHQSFDYKSIGGWDKVDNLAAALLETKDCQCRIKKSTK